MNGFGEGRIKRIYRGLGIGAIQPDDGGEEILFTPTITRGGQSGFDKLAEGDRVKFHKHPSKISGKQFAEDVWS